MCDSHYKPSIHHDKCRYVCQKTMTNQSLPIEAVDLPCGLQHLKLGKNIAFRMFGKGPKKKGWKGFLQVIPSSISLLFCILIFRLPAQLCVPGLSLQLWHPNICWSIVHVPWAVIATYCNKTAWTVTKTNRYRLPPGHLARISARAFATFSCHAPWSMESR